MREFPATAAGYAELLGWLGGFGNLALVGVEGTGSYGAGLARHLAAAGIGTPRSCGMPWPATWVLPGGSAALPGGRRAARAVDRQAG